jgi:indole-3-glycerol phosphate synthase
MTTILDQIIDYKRSEELPRRMHDLPLHELQRQAAVAPPPRDFVAALRHAPGVALIGEVKRASPSKGVLRADFDPLDLAMTYAANGAAAISVLTDEKFFQGSLDYLAQIRRSPLPTPPLLGGGGSGWGPPPPNGGGSQWRAHSPNGRRPGCGPPPPLGGMCGGIPLLRKDFIVHPYQVYEARAAGADALLLIAAVLPDGDLAGLLALTRRLGMVALVEIHDAGELARVLPLKPHLVGVNNRDLRTFRVDLSTCLALRPLLPADVCFVAESGIHTHDDVARLAAAGVDAMLVGEALVTTTQVAAKVRELTNGC